jgi:cell division protein FtsQ
MLLAAVALAVLSHPDRRAAALASLEHAADHTGLGLYQITVTGHRFTHDSDIFAALDLDGVRTLLSFDAKAARARIEELPWIERASVERSVPDGIDVRVFERVPFAVWRSGERNWLIDRTGRKLQVVSADAMPHLLRVAGEGAERAAAALSAVLHRFPEVAGRVDLAELVGGRRWTLHLKGGTSAQLPVAGEADALALLARLVDARLQGVNDIDLRVPARVLVRQRGDGASRKSRPAMSRPRLQGNSRPELSEAQTTASPPRLWGRGRVGGIPEHRGPLTPPHKGEGNPVASVVSEVLSPLRVGEGRRTPIRGSARNVGSNAC